jgi:hypothetical protein
MYTERFSELEGGDSKVAKKLVVKLYMEYQISMDAATVLTENKPVKRPREVAPTQRFFFPHIPEHKNNTLIYI